MRIGNLVHLMGVGTWLLCLPVWFARDSHSVDDVAITSNTGNPSSGITNLYNKSGVVIGTIQWSVGFTTAGGTTTARAQGNISNTSTCSYGWTNMRVHYLDSSGSGTGFDDNIFVTKTYLPPAHGLLPFDFSQVVGISGVFYGVSAVEWAGPWFGVGNPATTIVQDPFGTIGRFVLSNSCLDGLSGGSGPGPISFSATPGIISPGHTSTLSWSVANAISVSIDQGIGDVSTSGTLSLAPSKTTTYTLTATNGTGSIQAKTTLGIVSGGTLFAPPFGSVPYQEPQGSEPISIAAADFNGDGELDLAIANLGLTANTSSLIVALGTGHGGFPAVGSSPPFAVGSQPSRVAVADFNGDGKKDIAVLAANTLTVYLGTGYGAFSIAPAGSVVVSATPSALATGDFNGDGNMDLVVADSTNYNVLVLLGNGRGGFSSSSSSLFSVGSRPSAVVTGDFNGDGWLDVAVANSGSNSVTLLLGTGTGRFDVDFYGPFPVGLSPLAMAAGDFNGDGKLDLVVSGTSGATILLGAGAGVGGFRALVGFAPGVWASAISVADFNGDGKLDVALPDNGGSGLTVLLGDGAGGFTPVSAYPTLGGGVFSITTGDFNGDGKTDVAVANSFANGITVLLNTYSAGATGISGIGNGASFTQSYAPGALMSIFGTNLSAGDAQSASGPMVTVNGRYAPLLYISPTQINLQIPYEVSTGSAILAVHSGAQTASIGLTIQSAAPAIFVDAKSGHVVPTDSAAVGSTISFYSTGVGAVTPAQATGQVPTVGQTPVPNLPVTVTIGGVPVVPVYVGIPGWSIGVLQINCVVPVGLAAGIQSVVVTVGGVSSPAALLTVTP